MATARKSNKCETRNRENKPVNESTRHRTPPMPNKFLPDPMIAPRHSNVWDARDCLMIGMSNPASNQQLADGCYNHEAAVLFLSDFARSIARKTHAPTFPRSPRGVWAS